jgi:hypothetical protein
LKRLLVQLRVFVLKPRLYVPPGHNRTAVRTNHLIQSTMQIDYLSMARLLVQSVNILRDQTA